MLLFIPGPVKLSADMRILWKVTYETAFSSSSGMERFTVKESKSHYVATHGESMEDIRKVIRSTLNCQERLIEIRECSMLGRVLVET